MFLFFNLNLNFFCFVFVLIFFRRCGCGCGFGWGKKKGLFFLLGEERKGEDGGGKKRGKWTKPFMLDLTLLSKESLR
ncbi:hypothetical protein V8C37DRAFT_367296 [Trichoderma ceciliae]